MTSPRWYVIGGVVLILLAAVLFAAQKAAVATVPLVIGVVLIALYGVASRRQGGG